MKVLYIVIHHAASSMSTTPKDIVKQHKGKSPYHAIVEDNGKISYMLPYTKPGAHAAHKNGKNFNKVSLGICCIGNYEEDVPSGTLLDSLIRLINVLKIMYPKAKVIAHKDLPTMQTACPGKYLYKELKVLGILSS